MLAKKQKNVAAVKAHVRILHGQAYKEYTISWNNLKQMLNYLRLSSLRHFLYCKVAQPDVTTWKAFTIHCA